MAYNCITFVCEPLLQPHARSQGIGSSFQCFCLPAIPPHSQAVTIRALTPSRAPTGNRAPTDNRPAMASKAATGNSRPRLVTRPRPHPTARPRASTASRAAATVNRVSVLSGAAFLGRKSSVCLGLAGWAGSEGGSALLWVSKLAAVLKGERAVAGFCPFSLKNGLPGANRDTPLSAAKVNGWLENTETQSNCCGWSRQDLV